MKSIKCIYFTIFKENLNFSDCECYTDGTMNNECNVSTGKCSCNQGYTGDDCDQCDSGFFNEGNNSSAPSCIG